MDLIKISPELLAKAGASAMTLPPGDVIFKQGEVPDKMYVVVSGEVEIHLGDAVIEIVPQGAIFGEMALIDGSPRSATVIAKTDSQNDKSPAKGTSLSTGAWRDYQDPGERKLPSVHDTIITVPLCQASTDPALKEIRERKIREHAGEVEALAETRQDPSDRAAAIFGALIFS